MSAGPICCCALMSELTRMGSCDQVVVYRCVVCQRVTTLGYATGPGWVGARARQFLRLRVEALQLAGLRVSPAHNAFMDLETKLVHFMVDDVN
jgi:hypothetical protein